MDYILRREQWVQRPIGEVFEFFADAQNLEAITPDFLNFHIESVDTPDIRRGTHITYSLRLHGIRMRWFTEIEVWEPPRRFVDNQLRGPYSLWPHEHTFVERDGGTLLGDEVRYRLPFGIFGRLAHRWVRRDVEQIFNYRRQVIEQRFGT